jgi:hypothetical protein
MPSPLRFLTALAVFVVLPSRDGASSAGRPGANILRFKERIGGRTLRPGRYHLTITARAMAGGASGRATTAFRIVR